MGHEAVEGNGTDKQQQGDSSSPSADDDLGVAVKEKPVVDSGEEFFEVREGMCMRAYACDECAWRREMECGIMIINCHHSIVIDLLCCLLSLIIYNRLRQEENKNLVNYLQNSQKV